MKTPENRRVSYPEPKFIHDIKIPALPFRELICPTQKFLADRRSLGTRHAFPPTVGASNPPVNCRALPGRRIRTVAGRLPVPDLNANHSKDGNFSSSEWFRKTIPTHFFSI
ncbi:hypothetical protein AVEN_138131-1 [Araneus ventricosus]|uniref:Uncharacterized protein n=1 Tax=Araneus ventricosus TaxID=182803 RepID=A0A4Y2F8T3_ARAVE|nr:hypothetical protein AVEN_138131-1 [Araneus ventricosus]